MCLCSTMATGAADEPGSAVPDLTKGGELTRINSRWVGPVGIECGAWRPRQRSDDAKYVRQLQVLEVDKGSPADGILAEGDVILGADGTGAATVPLFESAPWAMIPIANAITEAEARDPALLKLLIWRPNRTQGKSPDGDQSGGVPSLSDDLDAEPPDDLGLKPLDDSDPKPKKKAVEDATGEAKTETVTIKLESLGRYSDTAPYNCPKTKHVLRKGIKALYESDDPGKAGLGILCLLAADDPTNPDNDKVQARAKEWAHKLEYTSGPWFSGPQLMVLSEYYMKTKDEAILPKLVKAAEYHARGVSWFGTTGHRWCEKQPDGSDNGRIAGYGPINCSGALGFLGLSLARKAGVKSQVVDASNERQRKFFGHFAFRGGIGYGEMPYAIGGGPGDTNGKHAMTGLALGLQEGQVEKAKFFCRTATLATYSRRQYAHGGSYFGQVWHPIGAAQGGVRVANLQFKEIRWHLDLKRRWDHTRIYDSSGNSYEGHGSAATALLFYAMPLRNLYITGRGQKESLKLTDAEFDDVLATRDFDASKATTQELIAALSRFQGMRRSAAGGELSRRVKEKPDSPEWPALVDQLLVLAADSKASPTGRAGACYALMVIKHKSKDPVASMKNAEIAKTMAGLLADPDPYIRFAGVRVLQKLSPEAVRPHANEIMDAAIATGRPTFPLDEEDPVQWAHGQMGALLVNKVLNKGLDGVDREKLLAAMRSLLKTPDGGARNVIAQGLDKLTMEEVLELADVIVDTVKFPAPANSMFDGGAEVSQKALAKYLFEEALPLSATYNPGSLSKTKILEKYGRSAFALQSSRELMKVIGDMMLVRGVEGSDRLIDQMKNGAAPEKLNRLKRIDAVQAADTTLTLPAAKTELMVEAANYAVRGENETTYTWRKVYGAGKVSFTPNASGQSKKTTVSFSNKRPGKYRFEVTMSDALGYNELTKTVDVTLYDARGKLPANKPPQAASQSLSAVPGLPARVTLSGTDPDGDDLGFIVTKGPSHGRLSGVGGELTYTASFGNPLRQLPTKTAQEAPAGKEPPLVENEDLFGDEDSAPLDDTDTRPLKIAEGDTTEPVTSWTDSFTFEAIDGQGERATGTVDLEVSDQNVGVVVYEGFDYPEGGVEGREGGTSFGFDGPWSNTRGTTDWYVVADGSLSYPGLPSTGGKLTKGKGWWPCSRDLDPAALSAHKLLDNGRELWFSVIVQGAGGQGKFSFGLRGGGGGLGFMLEGFKVHAAQNGEKAGTSRTGWSRTEHVRFPENTPNMIIGRCV